jgi:hypothetical protein
LLTPRAFFIASKRKLCEDSGRGVSSYETGA